MDKKKIAIIGSHGLYANYGGWDQLVKNLAEKKSKNIEYLIFNSSDTKKVTNPPENVIVKHLKFKASGFQGLFFDFWSIFLCFSKVDTLLLLGVQGMPLLAILSIFKRKNIVANVGGIEWERPKFSFFAKTYLRFCFNLSFRSASTVILDNQHYKIYSPKKYNSKISIIPYGGEIDNSMVINEDIKKKYPFLNHEYFLSISRALEDNLIDKLCESFVNRDKNLVLISNFSSSKFGETVYDKFKTYKNITLINGLYFKPELDLIRRNCHSYIHTHTLCGTAPSLVEMIISRRPILSIDIPQNRYTLHDQAYFFSSFEELQKTIGKNNLDVYIPQEEIAALYTWEKVVASYESTF